MISAQQTEKEFDLFFKNLGYERVSDDIGSSPTFQNADYVHKTQNVVVELKVLLKEQFPLGGVIESLNAIILTPESINEHGCGQYLFSLPEQNRKGNYDNISEPLRRTLKKANKQLKETKEYYFRNEPCSGYVVLAQTGLESISPEITGNVVRKALEKEFSSIDGAIICTPHFRTKNPLTLKTNPECISITKNSVPKLRYQCIELAESWVSHFKKDGFTST